MAEHYFSSEPTSKHKPQSFTVNFKGETFVFHTDSGVFSKGELDDGSLLLLKSLPPLNGAVLDLGCGWGALGVTLAKCNPTASFLLADINTRAIELSNKNIAENKVKNATVIQSDGWTQIDGSFDFVVTNPPIRAGKAVIYGFFDESYNRLKENGALYIVIRKQQGAPSALGHIESVFGNGEVIAKGAGFWIIKAVKTN